MNQPEPESLLINESFDREIVKPAYPNGKSIVRLFFVLLFYSIIGSIVLLILLSVAKGLEWRSPLLKPFVNLLGYIFSMLFTIRYAIKKSKKQEGNSFSLSFNKIPGWLFPVIIISTLGLIVGLERISDILPMPTSVENFFEEMLSKDVFSIITVVIAAPIMEELLCRGVVLGGLLKNYAPYKAILISALFFALIHLNPWQALPAFFSGSFLGWVFYKTKSVIPGMIIHATNNGIVMLFVFLPKNKQDFLNILGIPYYIALCVLAAVVFAGGCFIIDRKTAAVRVNQ
jgi:membrane protease YdiL (CAAX protease family)